MISSFISQEPGRTRYWKRESFLLGKSHCGEVFEVPVKLRSKCKRGGGLERLSR